MRTRRVGLVLVVALAMSTFAVAPARAVTTTIVPSSAAASGRGDNAFPFSCGSVYSSQRYQQVYLGSQVGSGTISQLAFRVKGTAFGPTTIPGITITLSTTSKSVGGLSTTFASNIGADVTTVFSGNLTISGTAGVPGPFDVLIPLQTTFTFNAGAGNLLLDVTVPTCKATQSLDSDGPSAVVSRVFTQGSGSSSATADATDTEGLVTQFTFGTLPPTCTGSGGNGSGTTGGAGGSRKGTCKGGAGGH